MKKHRKQVVNVYGQKRLVDVPVDEELYKADSHEEYQRSRSKAKDVSLDEDDIADCVAGAVEIHEEAQLLECLRKALQTFNEKDRLLIECIYFDGLTEKETAAKLNIAQQTVNKKKHRIISKLRNILIDWI